MTVTTTPHVRTAPASRPHATHRDRTSHLTRSAPQGPAAGTKAARAAARTSGTADRRPATPSARSGAVVSSRTAPRVASTLTAVAPSRADERRPGIPVPGRDAAPTDPTALCCSITQAAVESLRGVRPVSQLVQWLAPEVYEALLTRSRLTLAAGPRSTRPARIRRARVHRVSDRAVEATVVIEDRDRVRAAALRLEHHRGAWRVVAFVLG